MRNEKLGTAQFTLQKALQKLVTLLGENSTYVAIANERIGNIYYLMGNTRYANNYLEKSLNCYVTILGNDHPCVDNVLMTLGENDIIIGNFNRAEKRLRQALVNVEKTDGKKSIKFAKILAQLSDALIKSKKFKEAEEFNNESISIVQSIINSNKNIYTDLTNLWRLGYCNINSAKLKMAKNEYNLAENEFKKSRINLDSAPLHWWRIKIEALTEYRDLLRTLDRHEEAKNLNNQIKQLQLIVQLASIS